MAIRGFHAIRSVPSFVLNQLQPIHLPNYHRDEGPLAGPILRQPHPFPNLNLPFFWHGTP